MDDRTQAEAVPDPEKPPVKWATIREDASERGLFSVVDEAMVGRKLAPPRRRLIVGNIVLAVAKWRESFRDCGCWKTEAGYALCDWHERAFAGPRKDAERAGRALAAARTPAPSRDVERLPRCEHGAIREPCVPCREHGASVLTQAEAVPDLVTALQAADEALLSAIRLLQQIAEADRGDGHIPIWAREALRGIYFCFGSRPNIRAALAAQPAEGLDVERLAALLTEHAVYSLDNANLDLALDANATAAAVLAALTPAIPFEYGGALVNQRFGEPSPDLLPRCEHGAIREPCIPCREAAALRDTEPDPREAPG